MLRSTRFSLGLVALAALAFAGCATRNTYEVMVPLSSSLPNFCVKAALVSEGGVFDLRDVREDHYAFQLSATDVSSGNPPSLALAQDRGLDEQPLLRVTTSYKTGLFQDSQANEALQRRSREIAAAVVESCTGRQVEFGTARPCGRGSPNNHCVTTR